MVNLSCSWSRSLFIVFVFAFYPLAALHAAPVQMISIDCLKPESVIHAAEHGLQVPILRRFLSEGTYADGVVAVTPTVTYPDHTTLITGVWLAEHGIVNNTVFAPKRTMDGAWCWYGGDIRVPTLWDAAHQKGIGTASVSWPVSVNAISVDTLIPEYWRTANDSVDPEDANQQDIELMAAISRPDGMLFELQKRLGPYMMGNDTTVEGDRVRTRYSLDILSRQKPGFMTFHLSSLDESEHEYGPFSPEANKTLEAVDDMVKQLVDAAKINDHSTTVVLVANCPDPGLKALNIRPVFRGLKPPAPSGKAIYNCSIRYACAASGEIWLDWLSNSSPPATTTIAKAKIQLTVLTLIQFIISTLLCRFKTNMLEQR